MQINTYKRITSPTVDSTINITDWFNLIKFSDEWSQLIEYTRKNYSKNDNEYNLLKHKLPCSTYNFLFDSKKENKNITSGTGFMFFDIDCEGFDISTLDKEKIYCYYKSVGGTGYHIIVQVDGLTINNFKETYFYLAETLNISQFIDKNAIKPTQFAILSYDNDLYLNTDSIIYSAINVEIEEYLDKEEGITPFLIQREKGGYEWRDTFEDYNKNIKLTNKHKYNTEGCLYNVFPDKVKIIEINLWKYKKYKIKKGNRNSELFIIANKFVLINKDYVNFNNLFHFINSVNKKYCEEPMEEKEIVLICKNSLKRASLYEDKLTDDKMMIFQKNHGLNQKQIMKFVNKEKGQIQKNDTLNKLTKLYVNGMTQKSLAKESKMGIATIKRYWTLLDNSKTNINQITLPISADNKDNKQKEEGITPFLIQREKGGYEWRDTFLEKENNKIHHTPALLGDNSNKQIMENSIKSDLSDNNIKPTKTLILSEDELKSMFPQEYEQTEPINKENSSISFDDMVNSIPFKKPEKDLDAEAEYIPIKGQIPSLMDDELRKLIDEL